MSPSLPNLKEFRHRAKRFNLSNLFSIPQKKCGVYIFTHKKSYIYVGQSRKQGVHERLLSHHTSSHNEAFRQWISALGNDLRFTYHFCRDEDVDHLEKCLINKLQPITNLHRFKNYKKFC
jgi:hypothetical protein